MRSLGYLRFAMIAAPSMIAAISACAPTVKIEVPREPITINLNINLEAEVRVKLEQVARDDINKNPNVF